VLVVWSLCWVNNISEFKSLRKTYISSLLCYHSSVVFCISLCLSLFCCILPCLYHAYCSVCFLL